MYGVDTVAGKRHLCLAGAVEQGGEQVARPGLAVHVDHGIERVQPLLRLARIRVGELVDVAVEDHALSLAAVCETAYSVGLRGR